MFMAIFTWAWTNSPLLRLWTCRGCDKGFNRLESQPSQP
uniref:Uncharacterized protein n=1 Tax=Setaria viridis TaxID=4556 RepID=A0A4U6TKU2_SETVI|nr:hypothetical protein SEVIR_8G194750v2 [Setaria viridis]